MMRAERQTADLSRFGCVSEVEIGKGRAECPQWLDLRGRLLARHWTLNRLWPSNGLCPFASLTDPKTVCVTAARPFS